MALTKIQKEHIVEKLKKAVETMQSVVFVNFHGLSVVDTEEMRKALREQGVAYTVAKKTLLLRALEETDTKGDMPALDGEIAIAYGDDPVLPAGSIASFVKKYKDALSILGGIYEGRFVDQDFMKEIAAIPPLPVLKGMFVNVIHAPIQGLVVSLSEIAKKLEAQG